MEQRIVELELRFTDQQDQLQQLSAVVYSQQREIDALTTEVGRLKQKLQAEAGLVDGSPAEIPPHY